MESRPFQMKDGDILQLGVDYQGGTEDIFKSVKIRVEIGREWQAGPNAFKSVFLFYASFFLFELMDGLQHDRTQEHSLARPHPVHNRRPEHEQAACRSHRKIAAAGLLHLYGLLLLPSGLCIYLR